LGVSPLLGRTFNADEFSFSAPRTVVLSEEAWKRYFGGQRDIIGSMIRLDDQPHTVIGIMPGSFREPTFVEAWLAFPDESPEYFARDARFWTGFARLASGVNIANAQTEVRSISQDLAREYPESNRDWAATVVSLQEQRTAGISTSLQLLLGAVGLVLMIVCFNLANLLLARSIARLPEFGVRMALGASPASIRGLILGRAGRLTGIGLAIGAALALPITYLLRGRLFGTGPADPITYIVLFALIAVVTTLTALPLARRANRISPPPSSNPPNGL
jgi:ABC-type antimicrobial peptide transport system permease subunit